MFVSITKIDELNEYLFSWLCPLGQIKPHNNYHKVINIRGNLIMSTVYKIELCKRHNHLP